MHRVTSIVSVCCMIVACGSDNNSSSTPSPTGSAAVDIGDYGELTKTDVEAKVLKQASADELENHLKNGMRLNVSIRGNRIAGDNPADDSGQTAPTATLSVAAAQESEFSSTNTHVRGVDESDFIKYDGKFIYMATHPEFIWGEDKPNAEIRILETDPASAGITQAGRISLDNDQWGEVSELYLMENDEGTSGLVTLRSSWSYIAATEPTLTDVAFDIYPAPFEDKIQMATYDVSDPSTPERSFTVEIDGYLQASRKIGNTIYLVTQFSPHFSFIQYHFDSEQEAQENEDRIASITLQDLLPSVSINGGEERSLVDADDCLIPVDLTPQHGYHNILSIVAIDLENQKISSATCLNAHVNGIYSTPNNLYIGGSAVRDWSTHNSFSVIHKFNLGDEISYRSTGFLPGTLGWNNPSFRMDEFDNSLRVVTTSLDENWSPLHTLSILRDSDITDEMELLATLPNEANPQPIGKPDEDIYAVRFFGERAYIVTFERIDPLYIIDLSDVVNPTIAGELEVPGFSTYLHPVGDNYLLGIGQGTDDSGIAESIKVSLFDINDINAPNLIHSESFGDSGTWSSALYDLRAISFLAPTPDQLRFSFPISIYGTEWSWQEEALHLFEINGLDGNTADFTFVGKIISEELTDQNLWPSFSGTDRSVLHDEAVYYTHGNSVWTAFWSNPEVANGPH